MCSHAPVSRNDARPRRALSSVSCVPKILLTGMSGTGKSTALTSLATRGFAVVETDEDGWTEWSEREGGYVWLEERVRELLTPQWSSS